MLGQNLQADFNVSARPVSTVLFDLRRSLDEGRSVFRKSSQGDYDVAEFERVRVRQCPAHWLFCE